MMKEKDIIWHHGTGIIKYDPHRFGMKRKTEWWAIVKIDREITRYYRWWVNNKYWINLHKPSWDAHISIIRGERPKPHLQHLWKKYDGQRIYFTYAHNVRRSGDANSSQPNYYWFVEVKCPMMTQIRDEFELPSDWNFHITIGRTW